MWGEQVLSAGHVLRSWEGDERKGTWQGEDVESQLLKEKEDLSVLTCDDRDMARRERRRRTVGRRSSVSV